MIRPITLLAAALFLFAAAYAYHVKHQTGLLDRRIAATGQAAEAARAHIRLLRADWAVLNRPDRLRRLADQFLTLQPTKPDQFVTLAMLADHLPPRRLPSPPPGEDVPAPALAAAPTPTAPIPAAPARPAAPAPAPPVALAAHATAPVRAAPRSAPAATGLARLAPPPARLVPARPPVEAAALRPAAPRSWPPIRAASRPPLALPAARVTPAGYRTPTYRAVAAPAYRPAPHAVPHPGPGGSMLGQAPGFVAAPPAPVPMRGAGFGGG